MIDRRNQAMSITTGNCSARHGSVMRFFAVVFFMCLPSVVHAASSEDYLKEAQDVMAPAQKKNCPGRNVWEWPVNKWLCH